MGSGLGSSVNKITIAPDGTLYAGGLFTTAGGSSANRIASWDGSSWSALGSGLNQGVNAIAIDSTGIVYVGGNFTTAGGSTANYIALWNGTSWSTLGSGMNNTVLSLVFAPDETLYIGGNFTTAGGLSTSDRVARWNGYAFSHLDVDLPGSASVQDIVAGTYFDPVVRSSYDVFIGYNTTGTGTYAGIVAATNDGSAIAFPEIVFARSGGTTATVETLRNERTGKELLFNYGLLDGETLTIDLAPTKKSIVSSMFGPRQDAILPNSDFGAWSLLAGSNNVTSYINESGTPTLETWMTWKDAYNSQD